LHLCECESPWLRCLWLLQTTPQGQQVERGEQQQK
jgi:hypothetical protein